MNVHSLKIVSNRFLKRKYRLALLQICFHFLLSHSFKCCQFCPLSNLSNFKGVSLTEMLFSDRRWLHVRERRRKLKKTDSKKGTVLYVPGVCRQSLDPLDETKGQILHSLLEVRVLQAHLKMQTKLNIDQSLCPTSPKKVKDSHSLATSPALP